MKNILAFEDAHVQFYMKAPGYSGRERSGIEGDCLFNCRAEHYATGTPAILTELSWLNGTSHTPVLKLTGQATPEMLRDLAHELQNVAMRLEYDSAALTKLSAP